MVVFDACHLDATMTNMWLSLMHATDGYITEATCVSQIDQTFACRLYNDKYDLSLGVLGNESVPGMSQTSTDPITKLILSTQLLYLLALIQ